MSQLDNIVTVTITRETKAISRASFGIPGVIGEFAVDKTTVDFTRAREYGSLAEFLADGWVASTTLVPGDAIADAVSAIFRQNPNVPKVVVGRKDALDANWGAALAAVQAENDDWYLFTICPDTPATPTAEFLEAAAWTETQKKVLFLQTTDGNTLSTVATTDIGYQLKALSYDRTATCYHAVAKLIEQAAASWLGEGAPFEPGSSTWAYKTLAGVTADKLTTAQKSAAAGKNVNTYTTIAGASITEKGVVASGEYIDIIIGIDWIEARVQEAVFGALVNQRKLAFDDGGIQAERGLVKSVMDEAGRKGILQGDSIDVTAPKYKDVPSADRIARHLPDVKASALLQGAIHTTAISITVSV